jgi:hypothetical protein
MINFTKISAAFLAAILVAGTIIAISPSFMVGATAQALHDYGGIDNRYNNYEPEPEYPLEYADREYNSYEKEYGMDSYEKKSYSDDNYGQPEYPSYKEDYNEEYPKYVKDNYKSKKYSSSSVNINKLDCINNNVNINGNNTGDINVGNSGSSPTSQGTDEGYLGVGSSGGSGYGGEGYDNGYDNKKDKSFSCIINNNNINNNFGAGNETTPEQFPCEECFTENIINEVQLTNLTLTLSLFTEFGDLEGLCEFLSDPTVTNNEKITQLSLIFSRTNIPTDVRLSILECLDERGIIVFPSG